MADFCKQCSIDNFGEDFGELAKLGSDPDGEYAALCEGCGATYVNHSGECVRDDCLARHGEIKCSGSNA